MPNSSLRNIPQELVDNGELDLQNEHINGLLSPGEGAYINSRPQLSGDTISQIEGTTYHPYPPTHLRHELKEWPRNGGDSQASHQITEDYIKVLLAILSQ